MNNYPRNTKPYQTSSYKNLVRLLQDGQSWLSGKKYKLVLSRYYNMAFKKTAIELPESSFKYVFLKSR